MSCEAREKESLMEMTAIGCFSLVTEIMGVSF